MNAPELKRFDVVGEIPRGENNPRNSEGDFIRLDDGTILFAYSRYTGTDADDDCPCDIAGMISTDNGESFSPLPELLVTAKAHNTLNIMSVTLRRLFDGTVALFYLCKKGSQSEYYLRKMEKNSIKFGAPICCIPKKDNIYYVVNNCRVEILEDGRVLIPAARHQIRNENETDYFGSCQIFCGDKNGENWTEYSEIIEMQNPGYSHTGLQEPGLCRPADGRLYAYFRTDRCFQYESFSSDEGKTWTVPNASRFTSATSPMLITKNPYSGIYYAFWNPVPNYNGRITNGKWVHDGRFPFVMAQSENGIDFSPLKALEDKPDHGYCYPSVLFLNEKEFLISYCCGGEEDGNCLTRLRLRKAEIE
ncbi:MAG: exo-alpha-sialidase [Ruminococcus sp.]|nr:exo-alpha-sialidase [Candidatus Copronaster equi]